jgi:ABC-2 type transport system permease protein
LTDQPDSPPALVHRPAVPLAEQHRDRGFAPRRIGAMALRYLYLLRSSWTRIIELAYWPIMQMIMWGFMTEFLLRSDSAVLRASGVLIAAVLLWDVMFRSNIGVAVSFLEEMWSRNLAQLFASPLRPYEWALSLLTISLVRTLIGVLPAALLAIPLYSYSIFDMGLPLIAFFANLMIFGGAIGLAVSGLILRYGLGAESLAWVGIFAVAPISGIYYPIDTLPEWLQTIAWLLPSASVFEGMRAVLTDGLFRTDLFISAILLNLVYLTAALAIFLHIFRVARVRGLLLKVGE